MINTGVELNRQGLDYGRRLTVEEIFSIEPQLKALEEQVKLAAADVKAGRCRASKFWYGDGGDGFKRVMSRLVGWYAEVPALRASNSYDTMYRHLCNLISLDYGGV